ncbi:hypothetical protein N7539_005637 [Penicillium diatomitis]|uniref:Uncharacterized protein n=1 Tax=Penicillium diatomitis TaxID=2819901 RepID=A0A9W9X785_9EURO|nr:uncharacterized protein N7539_005637 [Penicillium diatomitis]KAJ5485649.1 hypothetical protein N7539_005637 [Penicillium diatomitis]
MAIENKPPLLLLTYPRSASNLLVRILSLPQQPNTVAAESGGYFFYDARDHVRQSKLQERLPAEWTEQEWEAMADKIQSCYDNFKGLIDRAETEGKRAVIKEHAPWLICPRVQASYVHGQEYLDAPFKVKDEASPVGQLMAGIPRNETVLPDAILLRCVPTFLVRHPALAFPSYFRAKMSFSTKKLEDHVVDMTAICTLRWTRNLYDWYTAAWKGQKSPIILDADDIINNREVPRHFCDLVGLDAGKVQFQWDAATPENMPQNPVESRFRSTLLASSGIVAGKTLQGLSIEKEAVKWRAEFGDSVAAKLQQLIQDAMADYEYLWSRRLTV